VGFPPVGEVLPSTFGKARVVENEFGFGALLRELELRNRVDTRIPADHTPSLNNSLAGRKLDMSSDDMPAE